MENTWRSTLCRHIKGQYVLKHEEWFDLKISTAGMLNLTIVSERFAGISLPERREEIHNLFHQYEISLGLGFLSLYTIQEAKTIGLSQPLASEENPVYSWYDLASQSINAQG